MAGQPATFVTIATPDRAAQSRVLAASVRAHHPAARLVVLALGDEAASGLFADAYDIVIRAEQLPLACLADMRFRYSTAELCFALKPWVMRHLLAREADRAVYYVDSDIEILAPLVEVEAAMAAGANLVLTPHILEPAPDQPSEEALLQSGTYNGGFIAVAPTAPSRTFLAWWGERLKTGGTLEVTCGDQKWLELVPSLFDGVTILRHPGYNFAFWNAGQRPLACRDGIWTAGGPPLRFVHYTKWRLPEQSLEDYLAAHFRGGDRLIAELFAAYRDKVREAERHASGLSAATPAPAAGAVPDLVRHAYARHGPTVDGDEAAVAAAATAVLNAPSRSRAALPLPVTVLYDEIWQRQSELRLTFDIDRLDGRTAYLHWLAESGAAVLGIPEVFLAPARAAVRQQDSAIEWLPAMTVGAAGERVAGGVSALPGRSGHVVYGPYVKLDPGNYLLCVRWRATPPADAAPRAGPAITIEAVSHNGSRYLAQRQLDLAEMTAPVHRLSFAIDPPPVFPVEIRIWSAGMAVLLISSLTVERIASLSP